MTDGEPTPAHRLQEVRFEDLEFVTLSGHRYVHVHLTEAGWKRHSGFLERRHRESPVVIDRRRRDEIGDDPTSLPKRR